MASWVDVIILVDNSNKRIGGQILKADSPLELISEYTDYSGRTRKLPDWSYKKGAIVSLTGGMENVRSKYDYLKEKGVQIAGVWV